MRSIRRLEVHTKENTNNYENLNIVLAVYKEVCLKMSNIYKKYLMVFKIFSVLLVKCIKMILLDFES